VCAGPFGDVPLLLSEASAPAAAAPTEPSALAAALAAVSAPAPARAPAPPSPTVAAGSGLPSALASQVVVLREDARVDDAAFPVGVLDVNGQQLDLRTKTSWLLKLGGCRRCSEQLRGGSGRMLVTADRVPRPPPLPPSPGRVSTFDHALCEHAHTLFCPRMSSEGEGIVVPARRPRPCSH
jgi:hypothetical protein